MVSSLFLFSIALINLLHKTSAIPFPERTPLQIQSAHVKQIRNNFADEFTRQVNISLAKALNMINLKIHNEEGSLLHDLDLRPAQHFMSNNFRLKHIDVDSAGNLKFLDDDPSESLLEELSRNILVDPNSNAVIQIRHHDSTGEDVLEGILNGRRISWEQGHNIIRHFLHDQSFATNDFKRKRQTGEIDNSDAIDEHRPIIAGRAVPGVITTATAELVFILDYENSKQFNWESNRILDYVSVLINAANVRFQTIQDPRINFQLGGIYTTRSKDVEKHFEKSNVGGRYGDNTLLESFTHWTFANKADLGKFDIISILTTVPFTNGGSGIAYIKGACWLQKSSGESQTMALAITRDVGGLWLGAETLAHELAHTLGATHDGDKDNAPSCPWADGHIMSYMGFGNLSKFNFSTCSQKLMKDFILSTGGACLRTNANPKNIMSTTDLVGNRITMSELCKKVLQKSSARVADDDPDLLCRALRCTYSENGVQYFQTHYITIGNDAECGRGGKCKEGYCIGHRQTLLNQTDKDNICQENLKNPKAISLAVDSSTLQPQMKLTPDAQCTTLICQIPQNGGMLWNQQVNAFLGNGQPCGVGFGYSGTCKGGKCIR